MRNLSFKTKECIVLALMGIISFLYAEYKFTHQDYVAAFFYVLTGMCIHSFATSVINAFMESIRATSSPKRTARRVSSSV